MKYKRYLGDGVYASFDGFQIWLAANNPNNTVVALEPQVYEDLVQYAADLKAKCEQDKGVEFADRDERL